MSLKSIEFYNYGKQLVAHFKESDIHIKVAEHERDNIITPVITMMELDYPEALKALQCEYKKSANYRSYYEYRIVNRFLRCNCGEIDNKLDIDADGGFHFEYVACPLRGDCSLENVVCTPKYNTNISDSEMRVMELLFLKKSREEIAEQLYLSLHTVNNHIRHVLKRLNLRKEAEFIDYAHNNNLFK